MSKLNIDVLMYARGISKNEMATYLNICTKTLKRKLNGETSFSWEEACKIQKKFFPDVTKDKLFTKE